MDREMMHNVEYDMVVPSSPPVGSGDPSGRKQDGLPIQAVGSDGN